MPDRRPSPAGAPGPVARPTPPSDTGGSEDDVAVALIAVDADGRATYANAVFLALFGLETAELVGRSLFEIWPDAKPCDRSRRDGPDRLLDREGRTRRVVWDRIGADSRVGTIALPAPRRATLVVPPLRLDDLTGLADRAALRPVFATILDRPRPPGTHVVAASLDLDRFKRVNDSLGHAAGDELLQQVARRLSASIRETDIVLRTGGDAFVILFASARLGSVEDLAVRIVEILSRPFVVHGNQVIIGASVGLASLEPGETDVAELLRRADVALHGSKTSGRGCVRWFEAGMLEAVRERRMLEVDLRKALRLDQFELAYQAQFAFETRSVTGFEALIRWRHPDRGLVASSDFIPIAEETREILGIGAWVLDAACRTARTWRPSLGVAVNISPVQFEAEGFVESVRGALAASGLPAARLELELTETVLLSDDARVIERMRALRALGVRLALDDFGTGCSSLNYLRKYPFTKVKIDQSFVREPFADENAHRIVAAVAGLGASMGMEVIAEGVETVAQLHRIRMLGCAAAQGYLLSRPIPAAAIAAYLAGAGRRTFERSRGNAEGVVPDDLD